MRNNNNKKLKIAFQMNDINKVQIQGDTTFFIMHEALQRGHKVYYYQPHNLSLKANKVLAQVQQITQTQYVQANHYNAGAEEIINLNEVDVIWLRQDPPFNMDYLTSTYFLDFLVKTNPCIRVFNCPTKVRNHPEKICTHYFSHLMPKTLITKQHSQIEDFLNTYKKVVIKPLYEAKGDDIFLLSAEDPNKQSIISYFMTNYSVPFVVQEFLPNVKHGDKRILIIDGVAEGAVLRVPTVGISANLAKGGVGKPTQLTTKEQQICQEVGDFLKQEGIFFAGIDVIDGYLTEINITSPTGLKMYYDFTGNNLATLMWQKIENNS